MNQNQNVKRKLLMEADYPMRPTVVVTEGKLTKVPKIYKK